MLWANTLQSASFIYPASLLLRKELPNLPFIMEKGVSMLDRL